MIVKWFTAHRRMIAQVAIVVSGIGVLLAGQISGQYAVPADSTDILFYIDMHDRLIRVDPRTRTIF